MARFLLFVGLLAGLFLLVRWLSRQPPRMHWQVLAVGLALVLLVLVLSGRANWLAAVIAMFLPFARTLLKNLGALPLFKHVLRGAGSAGPKAEPRSGQTSTVQGKYVRMTLNHDSGDISGEVLAGRFRGRALDTLELDALLQLLREIQDDEESIALLHAYLDRNYADTWQQQAGAQGQHDAGPGADGGMSRQEALQVLGLPADADEAAIVEAHRRLMQRLHPDRGGSAYLAARINLAKQTLLGK
jgi:hypothetical protein